MSTKYSLPSGPKARPARPPVATSEITNLPIVAGAVAARGYTDAERLAAGELVYTGMVRSFAMAVAAELPQSIAVLRATRAARALDDLRQQLDELPETEHPLGL